jgi:Trk-type K+ transport system membrane component
VTGLTVVDTATHFTFKGQLVIMILIQLGGLNIISFATFFASLYTGGVGIRHSSMMQSYFSSESLMNAKNLFRQIIALTLLVEGLGTLAMYSLWDPELAFESAYQKIFFSLFHAISDFKNAGFSVFTNGLEHPGVSTSYILHLAFTVIIFFGGLGFSTIQDVFSFRSMRTRMLQPWKKFHPSTRVVLYSSFALVFFGALFFFMFEKGSTLKDQNMIEAVITSLFHSQSARTAGFSSVSFGQLAEPTLLLFMFLMFVGASPGSTGGGIKTTTFTLIFLSAYSTIRGKRNIELFRRTIGFDLLNKAFSIFTFFISFIFLFTFLLCVLEPETHILHLMFEEVSAITTTGLSAGVTPALCDTSKIILALSMYIGRVGPLTLAFALSRKVKTVNYEYPKAHYMVG